MYLVKLFLLVFFTISSEIVSAGINNFHEIESDTNGFGIYRYGAPSRSDIREMCQKGIQEVMVLSGNAEDRELKYQQECPTLKVIYNYQQNAKKPVTSDFLNFFDQWVEEAKAQGKKIAFRCSCGCHRTGRLAAYYQMKYQKVTVKDAITIMYKHGKYMFMHPQLRPQVRALKNFIDGVACTQKEKFCVTE